MRIIKRTIYLIIAWYSLFTLISLLSCSNYAAAEKSMVAVSALEGWAANKRAAKTIPAIKANLRIGFPRIVRIVGLRIEPGNLDLYCRTALWEHALYQMAGGRITDS